MNGRGRAGSPRGPSVHVEDEGRVEVAVDGAEPGCVGVDRPDPLADGFEGGRVDQVALVDDDHVRRPDLVGFVNGLPLVVIEFKKPSVAVRAAFDDNLTSYKTDVPQLFWYNALLIASL